MEPPDNPVKWNYETKIELNLNTTGFFKKSIKIHRKQNGKTINL